jgi:hypothetical protein
MALSTKKKCMILQSFHATIRPLHGGRPKNRIRYRQGDLPSWLWHTPSPLAPMQASLTPAKLLGSAQGGLLWNLCCRLVLRAAVLGLEPAPVQRNRPIPFPVLGCWNWDCYCSPPSSGRHHHSSSFQITELIHNKQLSTLSSRLVTKISGETVLLKIPSYAHPPL